ncbi:MAG: hypothetical protein R3B90_08900 [Planctomycetaceae bacterium]
MHHDEQQFIRGQALIEGVEDLQQTVLRRAEDGTPILLRDVAEVCTAPMTRQGAVTRDGRGKR